MATAYYKGYRILEVPVLFLRRFDKISSVNNFSDTVDYFEKLWKFRRVLKDKDGDEGSWRDWNKEGN